MTIQDLETKATITWCPGCSNYSILLAAKKALVDLHNSQKINIQNTVFVTGIGCHAKVYDYLNLNGFYSIHGRVLPTMLGINTSNPNLTVLGFGGDGDTYAEGIAHFVHACRYNANITMLVHNNQTFALTTGQATPTSEKGLKTDSAPSGTQEQPLNPLSLAIVSGATFVSRGSTLETDHLAELVEKAIKHRGFAFVDILQPCITFHNVAPFIKEHSYKLDEKNYESQNLQEALKKAQEWSYNLNPEAKIPLGIIYQTTRPTYEDQYPDFKKPLYKTERKPAWEEIVSHFK